jgi:hypothetical protein
MITDMKGRINTPYPVNPGTALTIADGVGVVAILEIDIGELLAVVVAHDKRGADVFNCPRCRKATTLSWPTTQV